MCKNGCVGLGRCAGWLPDLHQQFAHIGRVLGHLGFQLEGGEIVVAQKPRAFFAQSQCFGGNRPVVGFAGICAAGHVGLIGALALLKRQTKARIKQLEAQIAAVNAAIADLLQSTPETARAAEIICSIPGLSKISAAALLIEMPELGTLNKKQAASIAGLAPMTRQSGQWRGKSFIQGGRKHLRDTLYMPALVASRYNPDLKAKYSALIAEGKPAKVALVALMRKLIILVNTLIREDRKWEKKRA
ncbi:MAG TPA: hypothetical protein DD979_18800 [Gammaproteobacteria bacterium]|nr:hypothetical protein [Gammaproteobacteria bacterium]